MKRSCYPDESMFAANKESRPAIVLPTPAVASELCKCELLGATEIADYGDERTVSRKPNIPRTSVNFVPAYILNQRECEIQVMVARRAYELFEHRARGPGHEIQDWLQAESELLYPCCHDLKESAEAIVLHVELPGSLTADELTVSVEPRRLMLSGGRGISVLFGDASDTHWEPRTPQIFRVHNLPADVDPSEATATLKGHTVEIALPKACATNERNERARSASSGR